mmetsp:Transcript_35465/g.101259  ORF Transcript_35465/g.101259 Transcript_35465/m.101259 type:complete len:213 (+) Transcript_35465:479-1117(+)
MALKQTPQPPALLLEGGELALLLLEPAPQPTQLLRGLRLLGRRRHLQLGTAQLRLAAPCRNLALARNQGRSLSLAQAGRKALGLHIELLLPLARSLCDALKLRQPLFEAQASLAQRLDLSLRGPILKHRLWLWPRPSQQPAAAATPKAQVPLELHPPSPTAPYALRQLLLPPRSLIPTRLQLGLQHSCGMAQAAETLGAPRLPALVRSLRGV